MADKTTNEVDLIWAAISAPANVREEEVAAALAKVGWAIDDVDDVDDVDEDGNGTSGRTTLLALLAVDVATATELEEEGYIERDLDQGVRVEAEMP